MSSEAEDAGRLLGAAVREALRYCSREQMADLLRNLARELTESAAKDDD